MSFFEIILFTIFNSIIMKAQFQNIIFVIAAMLLTSTFVIAQDDTSNDDWTNSSAPGTQNELNRTTITTTGEAAAKITFGNGTGSIATYGLNAESVPLTTAKGQQVGLLAKTSADFISQTGNARGGIAQSKAFNADGAFIGVYGVGQASALNTFAPTSPFSRSLGGLFSGGAETGTTLDIAGDKAYVGGTYGELVGAIDGAPAEGAAAAVIGIDKNTGTTPSYASYFEGNQNYMSGKLGIGTKAPASTLSVGGDGDSRWAGYFYKAATTSGDAAVYAQMPRPTSGSGWFNPVAGIIESGTGYARGIFGSSYNSTPQNSGRSYGVYAQAGNATNRANFGVFAHLRGQNSGAAVLGWDGVAEPGWSTLLPTNDSWAGYFIGDVHASETLSIGTANRPTTLGGYSLNNYRLYVCGGILAQELFINNSAWCDYVFDTDYTLTSLEDVETHIEEKGHLHNTPSEAEIAANEGFEIGEMTRNQQEKIEEIFLHLIDLNEQVKQLKAENTTLKTQVEQSHK